MGSRGVVVLDDDDGFCLVVVVIMKGKQEEELLDFSRMDDRRGFLLLHARKSRCGVFSQLNLRAPCDLPRFSIFSPHSITSHHFQKMMLCALPSDAVSLGNT